MQVSINGLKHDLEGPLSYDDIVKAARTGRKALHTVTWCVIGHRGCGSVLPGQVLPLLPNMVITALVTDGA